MLLRLNLILISALGVGALVAGGAPIANAQAQPQQGTDVQFKNDDNTFRGEAMTISADWAATIPPVRNARANPSHPRRGFGDRVGAQVFMVLCGLVSTLLAMVLAPRATRLAISAIDSEPVRCLVVGAVGLAAMGALNTINTWLFATVVWIPIGLIIAVASAGIFFLSGLLGIAFIGGLVARWIGWGVPRFFGRALVGFIFLAILNLVPIFGAATFLLDLIAFLIGLGGLIVTGLGRDPHWLSKRLAHASRESRAC